MRELVDYDDIDYFTQSALLAGGADGATPAQLSDGRRGAQRAARAGKTHRQGYSRTDDGAFLCQGGGL